MSNKKKIFSKDYYIDCLDEGKRKEVLDSVKDDIGFIV